MNNKNNIKLVATDMDGTLLNSRGEMPPDILKVAEALGKIGVRFAVASGRQYYNIRHLFQTLVDKVILIADNGGVTFDDNMLIGSIPIETDWHQYISTIDDIPFAYPVLSCVDKAYIKDTNMDFLKNIVNYYRRFEVVPDFRYLEGIVVKVSAFDEESAERNSYPYLKKYEDQVQVKVSAHNWVDLNAPNCNKGVAISNLQKDFDITKDQTMVFGDYLNDLEMMGEAKYSFAMKNAHRDLKKAANFEAPSNNNDGVIKVLEQYFDFKANEL